MDLLSGLMNAITINNLLFCFLGCVAGTLVGVLPGLGPSSTLAILLPITASLDPTGSIIMMSGICYGAMYGGSTTSILVNIPGEAASVATCIDGFQMTRHGRAGEALWIAAVGSFIAGTIGVIGITFIGPGIAKYALKFGPPEYFGLVFLSLSLLITFSGASVSKGLITGLVGIFLSTIGIDPLTGTIRLAFGSIALTRGLELVPVAVGLFGIGEVVFNTGIDMTRIYEGKLGRMTPKWSEMKKGLLASLRATFVGFPVGLLPGMTTALVAFMCYEVERRVSKDPGRFGTGVIEGVAAPEAGNNAAAQAGFIPLLALGIPTAPSMAILLGALMIYGVQPGPQLFAQDAPLVWTVIASMYVGNVMLLILNLPLVGLWARISLIPYKYLAPVVLVVCVIGAYSPRNTMFDVWVALAFGVLGCYMRVRNWPIAPLILGFILGPMLEKSFRQALSIGGYQIFFTRPISAVLIVTTVVAVVLLLIALKRAPKEALEDTES
ncbi:MAG: tripartite tricarboxylate transporter permease [Syntrophales bacterium]